MEQCFYNPLAALLFVVLLIFGCDKESQLLPPDVEQELQPLEKKAGDSENLLVNPAFALPVPKVAIHYVENGSACGDLGYAGLYWTEWLPDAEFTGVGNEDLFNLITCDRIPWLSYGNPVSIPGWMYTNGQDDGLTYRSFFDYYTTSNQMIDLGKGNHLWQEIGNPHGAVVYQVEYAWSPTFGSAGEAIVLFNQNILATHNASDYGCSAPGPSNCYSNYNEWADVWDFGGDPDGNTEGMQTEEHTVIVSSGHPTVTIGFEGTDGWFFPWAPQLGYLGILIDRVSVSAPDKVKICHKAGNNGKWHTIEIANNQSVLAHLDHGDHLYSSESCDGVH
jgi:hypothetical protein